jgi:L-idonate 5-dehydrogenase
MEAFAAGKGHFDVVFEAAGQGSTVVDALRYARPRATLVTVGQGATAEVPISLVVTKELVLRGSFRFDTEFALAVELIGEGRIDLAPLLSHTVPIIDADRAFALAGDKSQSMKVQIAFA